MGWTPQTIALPSDTTAVQWVGVFSAGTSGSLAIRQVFIGDVSTESPTQTPTPNVRPNAPTPTPSTRSPINEEDSPTPAAEGNTANRSTPIIIAVIIIAILLVVVGALLCDRKGRSGSRAQQSECGPANFLAVLEENPNIPSPQVGGQPEPLYEVIPDDVEC